MIFNLDEENKFQFKMEIFGSSDSGSAPIVEFKIKLDRSSISVPAVLTENGMYEVCIPPLSNIAKPGKYESQVSVIIGDRYFVPVTESVEIKEPVKPVISSITSQKVVNEPKVSFEFVSKPEIKVEAKMETESKVETVKPEIKKSAEKDPVFEAFMKRKTS